MTPLKGYLIFVVQSGVLLVSLERLIVITRARDRRAASRGRSGGDRETGKRAALQLTFQLRQHKAGRCRVACPPCAFLIEFRVAVVSLLLLIRAQVVDVMKELS